MTLGRRCPFLTRKSYKCNRARKGMKLRTAAVAGTFYPGTAHDIKVLLTHLRAAPRPHGEVHGLIVPHAGYIFSGRTAAAAYELVREQSYDRIVLLGPAHRLAFQGAALDEHDRWQTPLGYRDVSYPHMAGFVRSAEAHAAEHSLEVQVPFLQAYGIEGPIAPILVGALDADRVKHIAQALANLHGRTLFVVSSDLSHYYPREQRLERDHRSIDIIQKLQRRKGERIDACGKEPLRIAMELCAIRRWQPELLHTSDSGDASRNTQRVVGYASFWF
jgi:MEMO1 family protein